MRPFPARFPFLYHVTDRAALPGIRTHGLLCATLLCTRFGDDAARTLLDRNRLAYATIAPGMSLRWQGMPDGPLARRLAPGLDVPGWRRLINGMVFLFARLADAERLHAREAARDQVVLRFATPDLVKAGLELRACRYNNGYLDRRPRDRPRLRSAADYVPLDAWGPGAPREVTADAMIPRDVPFEILSPVMPPVHLAGAALPP